MHILAIDPGTTESAFVHYDIDAQSIACKGKIDNNELVHTLRTWRDPGECRVVIEMVACYGQPVGAEVFETAVWIGRFEEAAIDAVRHGFFASLPYRLFRNDVKKHLCHKIVGINDAVIRQVLIDRFGPTKEAAVGKKKTPGPLYGVSGDEWAALALAVTFADRLRAVPKAEAVAS